MPEPLDHSPGVTACTVVARNYLPAARVLARSYLAHHPGHEFVIAVIDRFAPHDPAAGERSADGYRVVGPEHLGIGEQDYLRMATAYSVTELATAVKPFFLRELRATCRAADVVIYLDPDIEVYAPMPEVARLAAGHRLVLTPHFVNPLPRDGKEPDETVIMGTGVFNLGFIATGHGSEDFLDFWAERLRHDAIVAPERQLFTDQRWVDQVPALFTHTVLRDPGYNVAYWNLHERPLTRSREEGITAGGSPLRFFHFSGYRPDRPWQLSAHCARRPRVLLSEHPVVRELCDGYARALRRAGYAASGEDVPYGFAEFADGSPITPEVRRLFRTGWIAADRTGEKPPPHAFDNDSGSALRHWLTSPEDNAQAAAGTHRLALSVWRSRTDLQLAFPHPNGQDAEAFRSWCATSGVAENALPEWATPGEPRNLAAPEDTFGVNIAGYLTAELGLGEMGRIVHDAISAAGVESVSVVEERALSNRTRATHTGTVDHPRFPVSLLAVNADQTPVLLSNYPELEHDRYTIGLWAWELEDFPAWQHSAFERVDEVWTISRFCADAIAAHSPVPVRTIPVPVRDPGTPARKERDPGEPTTFLFTFDFNSVGERKNPWGVVSAFGRAFRDRDDVRLVIKAINGDINPHSAERLRVLTAEDHRIDLIERYLSRAEMDELYRDSDCYVSLHRSEGFGLTLAESMAHGLPVISTDYSGTSEFVDESSGWLVPYRLVRVGEGNFPYHADALWAEPDLDTAAAAMRAVADDPAAAREKGQVAREHILRSRPPAAAAEWLRTELERAYRTWRERKRSTAPTAPTDPLHPLRAGKAALHWRPDTSAPSRTPLAPAMRKAVIRAIDHYDVHQRTVMSALVDGVENTASELLARIEVIEADQTRTGDLTALVRDEVARAMRPELQDSARTRAELGELHRAVDEWRPHTERALADLRSDLAELRSTLDRLPESPAITGLAARLEDHERLTHRMFQERDTRSDQEERTLARVEQDVTAVHDAVRSVHAPVPDGADVVVCDAGALLLPRDEVMWEWITHHRSWEVREAELMARLIQERPGAFLDIGAHVGYHTLKLLQSCSDAVGVIAVEADRDNFALLRRNIAVNLPDATAARVQALHLAAWDADGEVELVRGAEANSGDHRVHPPDQEPGGRERPHVPAARLDGRQDVHGAPVSLVKLDLQGRDHRAIAGLSGIVRRDRPDIVCEFSPEAIIELGDDPSTVLTGYRDLGYTPLVVSEAGPVAVDSSDEELVRTARTATTGFHTLWLRPS
ncbi:FkbM family methyltransferase [Haloechinothrix sp. YIM 98757]|uniref:FkbM family methyltransferase n=1 Tax=Haloechinothrix aidingensis TaxID=2752311 RepID=A0A838ADW3_9PSEU|nr:FkbM family methyltransferase [Haloechinothrix aidingensis]MBA0127504.1 FkbM family methyltransferase [Haloechinothrix aidingensis]